MLFLRRLLLVLATASLLCAGVFVAGVALSDGPAARPSATGTPGAPEQPEPTPTTSPMPVVDPPPTPTPTPSADPKPKPPELEPGPRLLGPGDSGARVRDLQARLKQIAWFGSDVTGTYGDLTRAAVSGFQAKREIPVTGEVDQRTLDRLNTMTTTPTTAELHNRGTLPVNRPGELDPRCRVGRVLCVDKSSSTLRFVVDGKVQQTLDARFGASGTPTREGVFHVYLKSADHVSKLYGSPMPFAMFFSGGQAVHYSSDFAARGYGGASHGCVNIRDYDGVAHLYDQVRVGDTVVVYWS
jgi:peptidoglycan hydrolase-like protein with peptidoglycan-binding domain